MKAMLLSFLILTIIVVLGFAEPNTSQTPHTTFIGHTDDIWSVSFSPDGRTLASGSNDQTVRLWDVETGTLKNTLRHPHRVLSVAFSPDGQILASGCQDAILRLWDGKNLRGIIGHTNAIWSVSFSPDGNTLASGSTDSTVQLWDVETSTLKNTLRHTDRVLSVAFSPDGLTLASGSDDRVRLWDVETSTLKTTLRHPRAVWSVSFSPDGNTLASGCEDGTVRLWDVETSTLKNNLGRTDWIRSVAFSPDGSILASGSGNNGIIWLWHVGGTLINTLTEHTDDVWGLAFSPDGNMLASGSEDNTVLLWEVVRPAVEDINMDGIVNIQDLVSVASNFGKIGQHTADVNGDNVVDIVDLVKVAGAIEDGAAAPIALSRVDALTRSDVRQWLAQAQQFNLTNAASQKGIVFLKRLLTTLTPQETVLLPNYPNPFNPETWIPYQLAEPTDVTLTIYAVNGALVRTLALGPQPAGVYQNKSRAAYWDGKNELGEPVASGVYFYTLQTDNFTATKKMSIRK